MHNMHEFITLETTASTGPRSIERGMRAREWIATRNVSASTGPRSIERGMCDVRVS